MLWFGLVWCDVAWRGVVLVVLVGRGATCCGVVVVMMWCGVVWCDMVRSGGCGSVACVVVGIGTFRRDVSITDNATSCRQKEQLRPHHFGLLQITKTIRLVPDSPAITRVVQKDFFAVQKTCCAQLG